MDLVLLLKSALMGIVEGLTEFLPISSTGHLIIAGSLLGFTGEVAKVFEIAIQTGAMFAVMWEYRARLAATLSGPPSSRPRGASPSTWPSRSHRPWSLGVLFGKVIKSHLFAPVPVALAFVGGALVILWVGGRHRRAYGARDVAGTRRARVETVDEMTPADALKVGCLQCLALVPGVSRSGATIIGGMVLGLSRRAATEFSFYLAIPTLIGAGAYSLSRNATRCTWPTCRCSCVGLAFAFVSALLCIRWLVRYISSHDFTVFAWYRIAFGALILVTAYGGWVRWAE